MNISLMNKRVTFQKNETVTDQVGNHRSEWTDWYTCSATISGEGGDEERIAGEIIEKSDLAVTVRYCRKTSLVTTTGYRIVMDGRLYNITGIDHFSYKKQALKFRCQKVKR